MPNLDHSRVKLYWAKRQMGFLQSTLQSYWSSNPIKIIKEPAPNGRGNLIYLGSIDPLPWEIPGDTAAIANALRSSLDIMTATLVKDSENGKIEDAFFPFVQSEENLPRRFKHAQIIHLKPEIQQMLSDLKPYPEGDHKLYSLSKLDNENKHRKLSVAVFALESVSIAGNGYTKLITLFNQVMPDGRFLIGQLDASPGIELKIEHTLSFQELGGEKAVPVVERLTELIEICEKILDQFDRVSD